jgi:hypothetical protein
VLQSGTAINFGMIFRRTEGDRTTKLTPLCVIGATAIAPANISTSLSSLDLKSGHFIFLSNCVCTEWS